MFNDVITNNTSLDEWPALRQQIHARISATMGSAPALEFDGAFEVLEETHEDDLLIRHICFEALFGIRTYGALIFPSDFSSSQSHPATLCMHGTDPVLAYLNVMSPEERPDRQYALELAQRGFVTITVDQFSFGQGNEGKSREEVINDFYTTWPDWSLDGAWLYIHRCALDIITGVKGVDKDALGCIGNSLGGRTSAYLAAFDNRIAAAVVSAGISPNLTNLFRNYPGPGSLSPELDRQFVKNGVPPFEYQELISLVADRGMLLLEPWNDNCNPMIEPVLRCFEKALPVFKLCGKPENLQIVCHGDGHTTVKELREYAYNWLDKRLS